MIRQHRCAVALVVQAEQAVEFKLTQGPDVGEGSAPQA
jgi:hypothetical protein